MVNIPVDQRREYLQKIYTTLESALLLSRVPPEKIRVMAIDMEYSICSRSLSVQEYHDGVFRLLKSIEERGYGSGGVGLEPKPTCSPPAAQAYSQPPYGAYGVVSSGGSDRLVCDPDGQSYAPVRPQCHYGQQQGYDTCGSAAPASQARNPFDSGYVESGDRMAVSIGYNNPYSYDAVGSSYDGAQKARCGIPSYGKPSVGRRARPVGMSDAPKLGDGFFHQGDVPGDPRRSVAPPSFAGLQFKQTADHVAPPRPRQPFGAAPQGFGPGIVHVNRKVSFYGATGTQIAQPGSAKPDGSVHSAKQAGLSQADGDFVAARGAGECSPSGARAQPVGSCVGIGSVGRILSGQASPGQQYDGALRRVNTPHFQGQGAQQGPSRMAGWQGEQQLQMPRRTFAVSGGPSASAWSVAQGFAGFQHSGPWMSGRECAQKKVHAPQGGQAQPTKAPPKCGAPQDQQPERSAAGCVYDAFTKQPSIERAEHASAAGAAHAASTSDGLASKAALDEDIENMAKMVELSESEKDEIRRICEGARGSVRNALRLKSEYVSLGGRGGFVDKLEAARKLIQSQIDAIPMGKYFLRPVFLRTVVSDMDDTVKKILADMSRLRRDAEPFDMRRCMSSIDQALSSKAHGNPEYVVKLDTTAVPD